MRNTLHMRKRTAVIMLACTTLFIPACIRAQDPPITKPEPAPQIEPAKPVAAAEPAKPAEPVKPAPPKAASARPDRPRDNDGRRSNTDPFSKGGGAASISGKSFAYADRPALIITKPMPKEAQADWKDDLNVMDKLLHEATARVTGETVQKAMGIRLMMVGNSAPAYIEDCGAMFNLSVNLTLISTGAAVNKDGATATAPSEWDRAKREISAKSEGATWTAVGGSGGGGFGGGGQGEGVFVFDSRGSSPPQFDQLKVDDLINAIARVLPEASHMRHLPPTESIIVSVQGTDDTGAPARLTLKASKADIDDAASGKITRDEFIKRVPHSIN